MSTPRVWKLGRPRWEALWLVGLTVFLLLPLLKTGYLADDTTNSLLPGVLKVEGYTLVDYLGRWFISSPHQGRFFPLVWVQVYTTFLFAQNLVVYKSLVIAGIVLDVVLFYAFVDQVSKSRAFACFALCGLLPLFQFRAFFDPILGFSGLLQTVTAAVLLSLLALQRFLDTNRRRWLALSATSYLVAMLMYEVTYPFFLIHVTLILWGRRSWRERVRACLPVLAATGACVLGSLIMRRLQHVRPSTYQINQDPSAFIATFIRQCSAGLPLSYYLRNDSGLLPAVWKPLETARFLATPAGALAFVAALLPSLRSQFVPTGPEADQAGHQPRRAPWGVLALVGLLLGVLPAALISLSATYQKMIAFGFGYLPVYLQYYGVALFLATAFWCARMRLPATGPARRGAAVLTALLLATVTGLNYRANALLVEYLPKPPSDPDFQRAFGLVQGFNRHPRALLEKALHEGLVETVPDHSVVVLANEYPFWHDHPHSRYFYAMHSGKVLKTIPQTSKHPRHCWFMSRSDCRTPPPGSSTMPYRIRDVCLGNGAGYVVLSHESDGERADTRLFVQHPSLFGKDAKPTFLVVAQPGSAASGQPVAPIVRRGTDLNLVRRGRDWALYTLKSEPGTARLDTWTLAVAFGTSYLWEDAHTASTFDLTGDWLWRRQRSMVLLNATESPRRVKVTMTLQARGETPVRLAGGPLATEVRVDTLPLRFKREITLPPGVMPLVFSAGAEPGPAPASLGSPPTNDFRVLDFQVVDLGPAHAANVAVRPVPDTPAPINR